jgi:hypothetical protein
MNKKIIIGASIGLAVLILILTNPNQVSHKDAVKLKFNAFMQKTMNEKTSEGEDGGISVTGQLGMMFGSSIIDRLVDSTVSCDNFLLFSLTTINFDGESKVMGVGVLGNVFISDKVDEELDKKMDKVGL